MNRREQVWLATVLFGFVIIRLVPTPTTVLLLAAIVIPLGFLADWRCKRRRLRTELLPLKQEFESLRRKLTEAEPRE